MTHEKNERAVFIRPGQIVLEERPIPEVGFGDALVQVKTTTICGTDVHILKGQYPVKPNLIIGHEPVRVIAELGLSMANELREIPTYQARPVQRLSFGKLLAVWRQGNGWLAIW